MNDGNFEDVRRLFYDKEAMEALDKAWSKVTYAPTTEEQCAAQRIYTAEHGWQTIEQFRKNYPDTFEGQ